MKKDYKRYVEKREDGVYMIKETLMETDTIINFSKVEQRVTKQDVEDMIRDDKEQAFNHSLEQKQTLKQVQEVENRLKNLINKRDYIKFKQEIRIKVKLSEEEIGRLQYLKDVFKVKTNASLLKHLLRIRI